MKGTTGGTGKKHITLPGYGAYYFQGVAVNLRKVAEEKTPIYFVIGEDDEYYGSEPAKKAFKDLCSFYKRKGLGRETINRLAVLDVKSAGYFSSGGVSYQHGGGNLFAEDKDIMGWLFGEHL